MRHRALQTGRLYVRQHPGDGQLSLDKLQDMVGRQGEAFSSQVLHYASSQRGTRQYWAASAESSALHGGHTGSVHRLLHHGAEVWGGIVRRGK